MIVRRLVVIFIMICACPCVAFGSSHQLSPVLEEFRTEKNSVKSVFLQSIPSVAKQFLGIPYRYGQDPRLTGATDNSYLFFSIYTLAAQEAGFIYKGYMPMKYLLKNLKPVNDGDVQNGDLMVLKNNLAAMVYQVEPWGKLYFIYASAKRQQVISFSSDNIVFKVYWMENFKGFYRIDKNLLHLLK